VVKKELSKATTHIMPLRCNLEFWKGGYNEGMFVNFCRELCTLTIFYPFTLMCFFFRNSHRMPTDVTEALLEIFMKEGEMDRNKAEELLKTLENTRRFQSETWS